MKFKDFVKVICENNKDDDGILSLVELFFIDNEIDVINFVVGSLILSLKFGTLVFLGVCVYTFHTGTFNWLENLKIYGWTVLGIFLFFLILTLGLFFFTCILTFLIYILACIIEFFKSEIARNIYEKYENYFKISGVLFCILAGLAYSNIGLHPDTEDTSVLYRNILGVPKITKEGFHTKNKKLVENELKFNPTITNIIPYAFNSRNEAHITVVFEDNWYKGEYHCIINKHGMIIKFTAPDNEDNSNNF